MNAADRSRWVKELKSRHGKALDAPRWLWSSVLELAALHEVAYLEHCRSIRSHHIQANHNHGQVLPAKWIPDQTTAKLVTKVRVVSQAVERLRMTGSW